MKQMNYNYIIEHIAGHNNVWADMISRWAGNQTVVPTAIRRIHSTPASSPQQPTRESKPRPNALAGQQALIELFTGLPCPTPLRAFYLPGSGKHQAIPANDKNDDFLSDLWSSIQAMHQVMEDQRLKHRLLVKKRERGENMVNFTEGDYVIRSRENEKSGDKLLVSWVEPYRVVRTDVHSSRIEHLITGAKLNVHASRPKFYAESSLKVTEERIEHTSSQGIVLVVEKLKEIEDSYEPLSSLAHDVPALVNPYVAAADQELKEGDHDWRTAAGSAHDGDGDGKTAGHYASKVQASMTI
ncbi:unnamed protein product [Phytophthora fragariaefolia]|uniref:Unnamed protein product n=1 Tax=Phytophthora fragariaefolia TaxID=1490495 RepID=A0A9W7DBQ0_9STRA|nr:unnamed protein product [Phytophthora fragariaefolia]